jgi:hypothetical protein
VPSLSTSFNVNSAASDTSTLTTSSFTPDAGDVIVVKGQIDDSATNLNTPTDSQGNTYTLRASDATAGHVWAGLWTAVAGSATSMTVSVTIAGAGAHWHSMTVEDWTNAALDATPVTNGTKTGSGTPSSTIVTSQANSMVSWCCGDWDANDPSGRTYNTTSATPTEDGLHDESPSFYVAYYTWQPAGTAGSQTLGLTAPGSQTWTLLGVEILHVAPGGGGAADQNQFGHFPWQ